MEIIINILLIVCIALQYIILMVAALEGSINDLIVTKRLFWLWVIPFGVLWLLFLKVKKYYLALEPKKEEKS